MRLQINYPLFTIYSGEPGTFPNNEFIVENTMIEIKIFCNTTFFFFFCNSFIKKVKAVKKKLILQ